MNGEKDYCKRDREQGASIGGAVLRLLRDGNPKRRDESFRKQFFAERERMEKYYPFYLKEKPDGAAAVAQSARNILRLRAKRRTLG